MKKKICLLVSLMTFGPFFCLAQEYLKMANNEMPMVGGKRVYNVLDFGAVGDGKMPDSPSIQKAIDAAAEEGGGARIQGRSSPSQTK